MAPNPSRTAAPKQNPTASAGPSTTSTLNDDQPAVNRKKQKRRQKQAAKLAAEQAAPGPYSTAQNGHPPPPQELHHHHSGRGPSGGLEGDRYEAEGTEARAGDDLFYSEDDGPLLAAGPRSTQYNQSKRKKNSKSPSESLQTYHSSAFPMPGQFQPPPPPPPPPPQETIVPKPGRNGTKDRIWNTSTAEERERIKEFWISLQEPERRSLVKVEKEAVLKKMKEQQKHSCSCKVCGRKRTAIEEELEVLYDAYYEELEQYANHRQIDLDSGHPMMPPPRSYPSMAKVPLRQDPRIMSSQHPNPRPMAGSFEDDDEEVDDEGYSEDDDVVDESEEDYYPPEVAQGPASEFFNFGRSLTVQGGILTVADDLLKNDGKKFIEMMEQLAERRMQREHQAQLSDAGLRHPPYDHEHLAPEDEEYEDEDDEDYPSDDDDDYEEEEMESMSEEQRMEEGRRMFQIFAARMFEQRVLTAYREKVARERQEKLLEELADEDRLDAEREAKKAKDAQKKKDKKKQQKAAKEEEKQKREAEKAAVEAAAKAAEEKKLEDQRQRKEEQRQKREAEKKAQEEERQQKEAEKLRRQQEIREQQAEQERKQREAKEREKKRKEETKKKERERKDKEAAEKRELEAKLKAEKEAQEAREKEAREKARKEEAARQASQPATSAPVPPLLRKTTSSGIPAPPGLGPAHSSHASPHLQIATPVIPKAPTPIRPRQTSQQGSIHSSPKSTTQPPSGSSATSPSSAPIQQAPISTVPTLAKAPQTHALPPQTSVPSSLPHISSPPGIPPRLPFPGMAPIATSSSPGFSSHFQPVPPPGMQPRLPNHHDASIYANQPFSAPPFRGFNSPNTMGFPPGINGVRPMPPGRGSPTDPQVTQAPIGSGIGPGPVASAGSHSRHASASFESTSSHSTQPIARPNPISRPANAAPQTTTSNDVEDLSKHLGSSALLDDTDDALGADGVESRSNLGPPGLRSTRLGFATPRFADTMGTSKGEPFPRAGWGAPVGFGNPSMPNHASWSSAPGAHWSNSNHAFGNIPNLNRHSRPVTLRLLVCQACKILSNGSMEGIPSGFGYHSVHDVLKHLEAAKPESAGIQMPEFLAICETEGNTINGGGMLVVQEERSRGTCVKWVPEILPGNGRMFGGSGPGEIGSPIVGSAMPFGGGRGFPPSHAGGAGLPAPNF